MSILNVEKNNCIATVTINNPPLNVINILNDEVIREFENTFIDLENDNEVVVIIITGAGNKAFMAGADIKGFLESIKKSEEGEVREKIEASHRMLEKIRKIPKPTIAVLNGMTFGGGCELALAFDIRIAEYHSEIGLPEVKLSLFPGGGGTQYLPRLIGVAKAKELILLGKIVTAEEAEKIGLVNQVVPSGEGLATALKIATTLSHFSLQALSRIKMSIEFGLEHTVEEGFHYDARLVDEVFQTKDFHEGVQAFLQKRSPSFTHE